MPVKARAHVALNFHGLGEPHAGIDADERPFWLARDAFAAILDRIAADPHPDRFAITFDDGNASDLEAAEMLASRELKGRFYVLAGRLGQPHYLSREDLRTLAAMGMTVGLHGRHHLDWRTLDDAALEDETVRARDEVALAAGRPVDEVAIPFGAYDSRVFTWLERHGFRRILTSDRGTFDPVARVWNRNTMMAGMNADEVETILTGNAGPLERMKQAASRAYRRRFR